jgi:F-type H+-transporting ATPase subunit b
MALFLIDPRWLLLATTLSGEEDKPFLMKPDPGVIFWTLIIFAILLVVLKKFAWGPILKAVHDREQRIKDSVEKADQAKVEAERALVEHKELSKKNRAEAAEFMKNAREEAEKLGAELQAKARREAEALTERARHQIEEERLSAVASIRTEAIELAIAAASHLLQKSLDQESHRTLVKDYIDQLPKNLERQ